ncbi:hypothetical protein ACCD06_02615 [Azospirillum sp. CT11-132]
MKLNEEFWLVVVVAAVYALVPSLGMPGYVPFRDGRLSASGI